MTLETKYYINEIAEKIINYCNIAVPVDVRAVVKELGGTIVEKDAFDDTCDAITMKTDDGNFNIFVAKHQDEERKRKAIARAVGHVIMHMGLGTNHSLWNNQEVGAPCHFTSFCSNDQASEFAMALLMPKTKYQHVINKNTNDRVVDIKSVAEYFNVSLYDAVNRGRSIGILQSLHPN